MNRQQFLSLLPAAALLITQPGFFRSRKSEDKNEERREKIRAMRDELLEEAYAQKPEIKREIAQAKGYAVFSNVGVNVIIGSFAGGSGVVMENKGKKETFMRMGSAGLGLGIGVKDYRALFIFSDEALLRDFVDKGWDFSGQADATIKSGERGINANAEGNLPRGVKVYQFTEAGLALQATVQATKYWKNEDLN